MDSLPILAIIAAAFLHAVWNYILKDSSDKAVCIIIIYLASLPFALFAMSLAGMPGYNALPVIILSAVLQTGYCILLFKGYEIGSLSSVYPIARGSAPIFIFFYSVIFFEMPNNLQITLGVIIICVGLFYYGLSTIQNVGSKPREVLFALAVGLFIAGYSITDATGARLVGNAFSFFGAMAIFNRLFLILYLYYSEKGILQRIRQEFNYRFVLAGLFAFICYAVVLWAYTVLPIPIVATLRESSIVFATLLGVLALGEKLNVPKLVMLGSVISGLFLLLNV